jgi:hypothetical protein
MPGLAVTHAGIKTAYQLPALTAQIIEFPLESTGLNLPAQETFRIIFNDSVFPGFHHETSYLFNGENPEIIPLIVKYFL